MVSGPADRRIDLDLGRFHCPFNQIRYLDRQHIVEQRLGKDVSATRTAATTFANGRLMALTTTLDNTLLPSLVRPPPSPFFRANERRIDR